MHLSAAAATIWLIAALFMGALWAWSRRWHRLAYFDVAWAGLMAAAALFAGVVGDGTPLVRFAVAAFGSLWAARLCLHLLHRRLSEDAVQADTAIPPGAVERPVVRHRHPRTGDALVTLFKDQHMPGNRRDPGEAPEAAMPKGRNFH